MGNCTLKNSDKNDTSCIFYLKLLISAISISNFELVNVVGRGGFGKVWIVINKKTKIHHALKIMSKAK